MTNDPEVQAAIDRIEHCFSELHDMIDGISEDCECSAPFCGCGTCIVREVLDAYLGAAKLP